MSPLFRFRKSWFGVSTRKPSNLTQAFSVFRKWLCPWINFAASISDFLNTAWPLECTTCNLCNWQPLKYVYVHAILRGMWIFRNRLQCRICGEGNTYFQNNSYYYISKSTSSPCESKALFSVCFFHWMCRISLQLIMALWAYGSFWDFVWWEVYTSLYGLNLKMEPSKWRNRKYNSWKKYLLKF
jgi:hypothetical protein